MKRKRGRPKAPRLPLSAGEGLSRQAKQLQRGRSIEPAASRKGERGQLSLEFLVIFAVLIVYLGFVLGVWKYSFDRLDLAAQRIAVNKVADELEFYSRFLSASKGASEISVTLFPTTRMAIAHDKESGTISIRSCSSQDGALSYERPIITNNAKKAATTVMVDEKLDGADCGSYPISGKVQLSVKKTIEGGLEIAGKT